MREWIVPDNDIGVDGAYFDYQELLRCKDCKWYSSGTLNGKHLCMINKYLFDEVEADDYCSRAERRCE